jgi:hypothetical protein
MFLDHDSSSIVDGPPSPPLAHQSQFNEFLQACNREFLQACNRDPVDAKGLFTRNTNFVSRDTIRNNPIVVEQLCAAGFHCLKFITLALL